MRKLVILVILIFFGSASQSYAAKEKEIIFLHVDNPEIIAFAVAELRGKIKTSTEEEWVKAVKEHALYAEVDINDDGFPERFLQYSSDCGTIGCDTVIYKRMGSLKKKHTLQGSVESFEDICKASISGYDPNPWVLDRKENGYHLIDTGGGEIIHWVKHRNGISGFCEEVEQ
jgi:hypothetical protein